MFDNLLRQPSRGARYALVYITTGTLLVIWTAIWFWYMNRNAVPAGDWKYYVCTGIMLSGLAVIAIGVLVGRIGREAQNADVPIGQVTAASITPATAPPAAPVTSTVVPATPPAPATGVAGQAPPAVTSSGQPVLPAQAPVVQQPATTARR